MNWGSCRVRGLLPPALERFRGCLTAGGGKRPRPLHLLVGQQAQLQQVGFQQLAEQQALVLFGAAYVADGADFLLGRFLGLAQSF